MNLQVLKIELDAGHLGTGAYDADDAVAAAQINARNVTKVSAINIMGLLEWASENERAFKLAEAQTMGATAQIKNLAIVGMCILDSDTGNLDPSNPIHVALVNGLVAGGVWSAEDKADLIAKATAETSRADILGLGEVRAGEVQQARAM